MHFCGICGNAITAEINIYNKLIGVPPVPIIDVIKHCMPEYGDKEQNHDETLSYICMKCSNKLLIFYKATLIVKKIKADLNGLREDAATQKKIKVESPQEFLELNNSLEKKIEFATDRIDLDEEYIKVEYVMDTSEEPTYDVQDEIDLEHMPDMLNTESLCSESNGNDNCIFETEKVTMEDFVEKIQCSTKHNENLALEPFNCVDCDMVFKNIRKYNAHRNEKHFPGFICEMCGKTFVSHSGFKTHKRTHKPVKEFICTECGEGFNQKGHLGRHMAWHSGEMPFQCDICSKRFVHKVALSSHKKIHEDIRNVICTECGFKFRTKAHLNRHMMTHTGAKPHSCPVCGKCFSQMYNMKVHIKEHESPGSTRRNRLKCKKCSKTFSHKEKYEDHLQRSHK